MHKIKILEYRWSCSNNIWLDSTIKCGEINKIQSIKSIVAYVISLLDKISERNMQMKWRIKSQGWNW